MRSYIVQSILIFVVLGLQLGATRLDRNLVRQIEFLEFGAGSAMLAIFSVILGLASGVLLVYALFSGQRLASEQKQNRILTAVVLGILPLLAILLKVLIAAYGPGFLPVSVLRPGWSELFEWVLYSQAPALWLGLVIGRFLPRP